MKLDKAVLVVDPKEFPDDRVLDIPRIELLDACPGQSTPGSGREFGGGITQGHDRWEFSSRPLGPQGSPASRRRFRSPAHTQGSSNSLSRRVFPPVINDN